MKYYLLILTLLSGVAYGQSSALNLSLPSSGSNYQSDKFRAGNLDCQNAIGSSTNVEFGVVGIIKEEDPTINLGEMNRGKDVGVYAKITIPIGAPKERIDCSQLYKLELEARRLEVQQLRIELMKARGRNLEFEN